MRRSWIVVLLALSACSAAVEQGPPPSLAGDEVIGDWTDSANHRVCTVYSPSTDREHLSKFAKSLPNPDGRILRVEFYAEKDKTPVPTKEQTLDDVVALCYAPDLDPIHIASYDGSTGTIFYNESIP